VDEISDELNDPLMNYVETECGIVPPAAHHHHQQQQQPQIIRAGSSVDTSPRKKSRLAIPVHGINALPDPRTADVTLPTVVSTPQKVASILASQLPRTSVPPGVPMPQLPSVQQYHLPPSSGKTSFEQLMQVSVFFSILVSMMFTVYSCTQHTYFSCLIQFLYYLSPGHHNDIPRAICYRSTHLQIPSNSMVGSAGRFHALS
jgi:hypothetical protein